MVSKYSKILVTGGAGFIGSHLVDRLLAEDFEVTVLDNLSSGKQANIIQHMDRSDFKFIKGDIRDRNLLQEVMKDVDSVFHEAALVSVPISVKDPLLTNEINVGGTLNLLKTCLDLNIKRFIFASSAAVYGEAETLLNENVNPRPTSPYGVSKLASENYIEIFHNLYHLKTVCLRYFNVYGPRQARQGGAINIFINQILNNQPPTIYGDGEQTRDFINIKDVVDANMLALKNEAVSGTFNVASGTVITINHLVKIIMQLTGKTLKPIYLNPRPGDPRGADCDISKARKTLGFNPKISIKDGLCDLIEWHMKQIASSRCAS